MNIEYAKPRKIDTTKALIEAMHNRYKGKWFNEFTFVQNTEFYNPDGSVRNKSTWYEAIRYPDFFRIDYGLPSEGNANIFRRDSAYRFRADTLAAKGIQPQEFLLMKGGLYHYNVTETLEKLEGYGYDTNTFHETKFGKRKVYVIGAEKGDLQSKQFWLDKKNFYMVRRISKLEDGRILEAQYSNHIKSGGGWVEQVVKFYLDGQYIQFEEYTKIDTNPGLKDAIFDPDQFGKTHWFTANDEDK